MKKPIYLTPSTEYVQLASYIDEVICTSASIESYSDTDEDFNMFESY